MAGFCSRRSRRCCAATALLFLVLGAAGPPSRAVRLSGSTVPLGGEESVGSSQTGEEDHGDGIVKPPPAVPQWLVSQNARHTAGQAAPVERVGFGTPEEGWVGSPTIVSWDPRVIVYDNFLSEEECKHIKDTALPELRPAKLVDKNTGLHYSSPKRTSMAAVLEKGQDAVVTRIQDRVAAVTGVPPEHGEPLLVMRYRKGEKYTNHVDYYQKDTRWFSNTPLHGGQRMATMLLYLETTPSGGETVFPSADKTPEGARSCTAGGAAVAPVMGRAVLFWDTLPDGSVDKNAVHGSCPVEDGEKWAVTRWLRARPFPLNANFMRRKWGGSDDLGCVDDREDCDTWKAEGKCATEWGVGNSTMPGYCEKTCGCKARLLGNDAAKRHATVIEKVKQAVQNGVGKDSKGKKKKKVSGPFG